MHASAIAIVQSSGEDEAGEEEGWVTLMVSILLSDQLVDYRHLALEWRMHDGESDRMVEQQ